MKRSGGRRYGGELLFSARDDLGPVEVVQQVEMRRLHFGNFIEQSCYVPEEPDWLQFEYTRQLALATVFPAVSDKVLILGLGAGVVAAYLLRHLGPSLQLDAVEYREVVADVAYQYFDLPIDPRLQVYIASAEHYLSEVETLRDVIIVDLYDADGMNEEAAHHRFIQLCRSRLRPGGVAAFNLWRSDLPGLRDMVGQLRQVFDNRVLLADSDDANTVAYCFADQCPDLDDQSRREGVLEKAVPLAFDGEAFLREIYR